MTPAHGVNAIAPAHVLDLHAATLSQIVACHQVDPRVHGDETRDYRHVDFGEFHGDLRVRQGQGKPLASPVVRDLIHTVPLAPATKLALHRQDPMDV